MLLLGNTRSRLIEDHLGLSKSRNRRTDVQATFLVGHTVVCLEHRHGHRLSEAKSSRPDHVQAVLPSLLEDPGFKSTRDLLSILKG